MCPDIATRQATIRDFLEVIKDTGSLIARLARDVKEPTVEKMGRATMEMHTYGASKSTQRGQVDSVQHSPPSHSVRHS